MQFVTEFLISVRLGLCLGMYLSLLFCEGRCRSSKLQFSDFHFISASNLRAAESL